MLERSHALSQMCIFSQLHGLVSESPGEERHAEVRGAILRGLCDMGTDDADLLNRERGRRTSLSSGLDLGVMRTSWNPGCLALGSAGYLRALEPSTLGQRLMSSEREPPAALGRHSRRRRAGHVRLMDHLVS